MQITGVSREKYQTGRGLGDRAKNVRKMGKTEVSTGRIQGS